MLEKLVYRVAGSNVIPLLLRQQASVLRMLSLFSDVMAYAEYAIFVGRSINWYPSGLGVVGGIPTSFLATNTITGVDPTGSADSTTAINSFLSENEVAFDHILISTESILSNP
jgi:hypothetical protein